jgi:SWI/SNF-related matrix-associated actin-dependent regulator of chromatin subfamily B protein 1
MVASENDRIPLPSTPLPGQMTMHHPHQNMQQTAQKQAQPQAQGKSRGLFKAPAYPSAVLKPRSAMTSAIESTAVERDAAELAAVASAVAAAKGDMDEDGGVPSGQPLVSLTGERRSTTRVPTAKRLKELEREEKEKEYAKRQHANLVDGVWHCSNCGCPDDIAIGRRKGPLGDKSQCGDCGMYLVS